MFRTHFLYSTGDSVFAFWNTLVIHTLSHALTLVVSPRLFFIFELGTLNLTSKMASLLFFMPHPQASIWDFKRWDLFMF
jgi:hypothetical protein